MKCDSSSLTGMKSLSASDLSTGSQIPASDIKRNSNYDGNLNHATFLNKNNHERSMYVYLIYCLSLFFLWLKMFQTL